MKRICADVGGTFTDCLVLDLETGKFEPFKALSTPDDPSRGFMAAIAQAADYYGETPEGLLSEVELLIHGTTLATNTVLTGTGARTGMITTAGFRDSIEMRRGLRDPRNPMYNIFIPPYEPLVPRYLRLGVTERLDNEGRVIEPVDEAGVRQAATELQNEGVESVAVCFLYSYINPEHERAAARIAGDVLDVPVTESSRVLPVWREFERFSTAVVNAYVEPRVAAYLRSLDAKLRSGGFGGRLLMVLSNGLMETVDQCFGRSVYLLNSGPAAAPAAASYVRPRSESDNIISIDMGGTSFDVCLVVDGQIPTSDAAWIGDHRVAIRMVDVKSIGAGGGGIAWIDALGLLRVGPQSAGSDPGPACFGKGEEPTVTDADLLLGYIPADYFLGGKETLSVEAARTAMERVAQPLGMDADEAAQAVVSTVNAAMADLITEVCTRRGLDVRDFEMVAGGGAGPVHAAFIADLTGVQHVLVPSMAPLMSAFGMFTMDLGRDFARSYFASTDDIEVDRVASLYQEMEDEARRAAVEMGIPVESLRWTRTAELRYFGQFHEVETPIPDGPISAATLQSTVSNFHREHESLFNFSMPWLQVQFLTFRLLATAAPMPFSLPSHTGGGAEPRPERTRRCSWSAGWLDTPVYRSGGLAPGHEIRGPAIVEEQLTTVVIPEGWCARIDEHRNYRLTRASSVSAEKKDEAVQHA